jgi:putative ABC transport system permease protein
VISAPRLAWLQLRRETLRLVIALSGVAFAVVLIFMQLGFSDALFTSAVNVHRRLDGDIFFISPHSNYLATMKVFSRRRLYQALGFEGVESVASVYTLLRPWVNPWNGTARDIFVVGVDPADHVFTIPEIDAGREVLKRPDVVLFDEASRPEYGPVAARVKAGEPVSTEVNRRHVDIKGLFRLGTSFGIDGTIVTSDLNFLRMFPERSPGLISIGVIKLKPGVDPEAMTQTLASRLDKDVLVLTKDRYIAREKDYWGRATPIGYVFSFGVIMGLVVGGIIVYQILFADISDHLAEYATLKAMGYRNRYLIGVVLMEAVILAVIGYLPGVAICVWLYRLTESATQLPMQMWVSTSALVLVLTIAMCAVSGLIAVRKIRSADPAEIF